MYFDLLFEYCLPPRRWAGNESIGRPRQLAGFLLSDDTIIKGPPDENKRTKGVLAYVFHLYITAEGITDPSHEVITSEFMPISEDIDAGHDWNDIRERLIDLLAVVFGQTGEGTSPKDTIKDIWNYLHDPDQYKWFRYYPWLAKELGHAIKQDDVLKCTGLYHPRIEHAYKVLSESTTHMDINRTHAYIIHNKIREGLPERLRNGVISVVDESYRTWLQMGERRLPDERPLVPWIICWRHTPIDRIFENGMWRTQIHLPFLQVAPFSQWTTFDLYKQDAKFSWAHLNAMNRAFSAPGQTPVDIPEAVSYQEPKKKK